MLEKNLQVSCLRFCKENNIIARKVDSSSSRGWPDLTVILPNGVVLFVELKTEKGVLSALQKRTIKQLEGNNANVYVCRTVESFKKVIDQHHGKRRQHKRGTAPKHQQENI